MDTYTVKQIAALLDTNEETVRRWIRSGKIHAAQKSRKDGNLVSDTELNRFLVNTPKYMAKYLQIFPTTPPAVNLATITGGVAISILRGYMDQKKTNTCVTSKELKRYLQSNIKKWKEEEKKKQELIRRTHKELEAINEKIKQYQYMLDHEDLMEQTLSTTKIGGKEYMWDYAELAKAAKTFGGPEKMLRYIKSLERAKGRADMYPWIVATAFVSALAGLGGHKLVEYFHRNQENEKLLKIAEEEIIQGIKAYESEHPEEPEEQQESGEIKAGAKQMPIGCEACGGNYPVCAAGCPLMDEEQMGGRRNEM